MAKARRVDINLITDLIRPTSAQPEPEWRAYVAELEGLSPGEAVEFTPDEGERPRAIMQRAARAAHSLGLNIRNYRTARGTVVCEVLRGTWQPKAKSPRQEGEGPTNGRRRRGRPPRAAQQEAAE